MTDEVSEPHYDEDELSERFVPEFVDPRIALAENAKISESDPAYGMAYRENFILQLLIESLSMK